MDLLLPVLWLLPCLRSASDMILTDSVVCCCLLPMGPALPCLRSAADMILDEFTGVYGVGTVAAVNPVWDQGALDGLVGEYTSVRGGMDPGSWTYEGG